MYKHQPAKEDTPKQPKTAKRKGSKKVLLLSSEDSYSLRKRQATVSSVGEMTKLETMMDELFLTSCLESFDRTMGTYNSSPFCHTEKAELDAHTGLVFSFRSQVASSSLVQLHSTAARSVRTDSVLACVCRGVF